MGCPTEGRVYYIGPRKTPMAARVKLDISANETVVRPPVLRTIAHPYPDGPLRGQVRSYSFEEVFAEKIRAMAQRARPRDLYDIVNLFRRNDLRLYPDVIRATLKEKCDAKSVAVPTASAFTDADLVATLATSTDDASQLTPLSRRERRVSRRQRKRVNPTSTSTSVWTSNISTAHQVARALHAGNVYVNCFDRGDNALPFGGHKQSGQGVDKSLHAMEKYTRIKTTWIEL